jgi:IMP dehydrogenase
MTKTLFTFDDVLIAPKFSTIESRKDVDLSCLALELKLPIISANMDTVTGKEMALAMAKAGGIGCLHRFCSIEENLHMMQWSTHIGTPPMVSIGLGTKELERAEALFKAQPIGAENIVIDVAHGAQMSVVKQARAVREIVGSNASIIVGNFATADSVKHFLEAAGTAVDGFKVGIGPGSACTTRIKTGVGVPQLSAIMEIVQLLDNTGLLVIADGGMRTPGDVAKALGAGADLVMLGGMLAGTYETPGETVDQNGNPCNSVSFSSIVKVQKKYRGSASKESYEIQGKDSGWRTAEGESFLVPYKGSIAQVLQDIEGGLRSAFSYVGARTLAEFHARCEFIQVTANTVKESIAHGNKS